MDKLPVSDIAGGEQENEVAAENEEDVHENNGDCGEQGVEEEEKNGEEKGLGDNMVRMCVLCGGI